MRNILLSAFLLLMLGIMANLSAQEPAGRIIYLRNGSILHGHVLEDKAGDHIRLEMVGMNQLVIPYAEIEKTEAEQSKTEKKDHALLPIEVSSSANFYGGSKNSGGFTISPAYRFPCGFGAGLGTGIDFFTYELLPVYADLNQTFFKGRFKPFIYAKAGYSFPLSKASSDQWYDTEYKGGILAGAGAGLKTELSENFSMLFSIGYRYQKLREKTENYPWYYGVEDYSNYTERIDHLNRIQISIGFVLK